ncbi:pilus assembly PilX N-terminal domain-containing protein, partial [Candidatus Saccharibacteria bacterium]|nr:pilus assembly PilX N-terminal domain-containing protein [Candidatus Saccharibacteria bacterium]
MNKITSNQAGLVSIVVTMVFLSVITLITVSFAFLMRREQRQVLDRQLSTQAFYAAESGVNDAVAALKAGTITGDIDTCGSPPYDENLSSVISYSCMLIDQSPDSLEFDPIAISDTKG